GAQHARGERRGVNGCTEPRPHVDDRAEVVLVRMGQDDPDERTALLFDEAQIGKHDIDARLVLVREGQTEVDHEPAACVFRTNAVKVDVEADLAEAAEAHEDDLVLAGPAPGSCLPCFRHCRSLTPAATPNDTSP